jgi:hypothetical protein
MLIRGFNMPCESSSDCKPEMNVLTDFLCQACRNLSIHTLKSIEHGQENARYQDLFGWYLAHALDDFENKRYDEILQELERIKWREHIACIACSACPEPIGGFTNYSDEEELPIWRFFDKYKTFDDLYKEFIVHTSKSKCGGIIKYHFYIREPLFIRKIKNNAQQAYNKQFMDKRWNSEKEVYE